MALWLVRAGKGGRYGDIAIDEGVSGIGWAELGDLSGVHSRDELESIYRREFPDASKAQVSNAVGQVWSFISRIQRGDIVAIPISQRSVIAIGRFTGGYHFRPDLPLDLQHARAVEWIKPDLPRTALDEDLLYSFGTLLTVAQIQRNDAEERIRAIIEGRKWTPTDSLPDAGENVASDGADSFIDLEEYARERIRDFISRRFRGHSFADLITAILSAQGYTTDTSQPGRDGGVDIVAGRGPMGFDAPRLVVQVKSSDQPSDVTTLRELRGVLHSFGAQQGLLVSWGGFRQSVPREARQLFFEIRLWGPEEILDALLENYDRLPDDLRAELPLKRIWTLVPED